MPNTRTLSLDAAHDLIVAALTASRTSKENAESVARALVRAEADGQKGHGLSRIPFYTAQARSGKVNGFAVPTSAELTPALVRVDAADGFAYPAFDMALAALPDMARKLGLAMATVSRSHHFGQAGAHCERLAEQGLVALVFGNATGAIAPWGGKSPLFGTNPIAMAAPAGEDQPPLVIDLAVSRVARGKVITAQQAGQKIPEGWALDRDGNPTTDPDAAMNGTMIPIGEAKGAALAMMVEVMSAALVGAAFGFETSGAIKPVGEPANLGQTIIAINPQLTSNNHFYERMGTMISTVVGDGARLPGSRRLAMRSSAHVQGIEVSTKLLDQIDEIIANPVAEEVG